MILGVCDNRKVFLQPVPLTFFSKWPDSLGSIFLQLYLSNHFSEPGSICCTFILSIPSPIIMFQRLTGAVVRNLVPLGQRWMSVRPSVVPGPAADGESSPKPLDPARSYDQMNAAQ